MGYHRAGFEVVGVDKKPQPHYPFEFHQADALDFPLDGFDVIHASPPCQAYSTLASFTPAGGWPDLYEATRERLVGSAARWVIENVVGAPYRSGFILCGSMFGLKVRRHRNFECSELMFPPACDHAGQGRPVGVYGHGQFYWENGVRCWRNVPRAEAEAAMGIDWMSREELSEAIPPAFTEWVGTQLLNVLEAAA